MKTKIVGTWLNFSEVCPSNPNEEVYVWPRPEEYDTAFYDKKYGGWRRGGEKLKVTHWMHMPPPPDGPE